MTRIICALAFSVALSAGPVHAAVYHLIDNATAAVSSPTVAPARSVSIQTGTTGAPASVVTYQVIVGDSASACTVQPVGSNDGVHWTNQGSAITVATGGLTGSSSITATWAFWGATVTSVTGTCTVLASG